MAFIYDLTDTWNNAGTSFNGIKLNATDTASAAGSKLLDLQINGASKLAVGKTGTVTATGIIESTVGGFKFPDATTQTTKATVNSVSGTGSVNGITLTGSVTNTGSLTLGGTLGNIANNQLTNSAITINGTSTALGGSIAVGTVTSVGGTGTVSGLSLTGSVTTSGSLTLGGTLVLTSGQVTDGLGYTPYNATNPTGYITAAALTPYLTSATAATTYQPLDGDLTAIAALAGTAGLVRKTAANTYSLDTAVYITGITSGDVTTALGFTPYNATNPSNYLSSVSLTSNVTGTLPIANGGTGATTDSGARTALGLGTAAVLNSGVAGGVATLDGSGTVPTSQLPGAVLGGLNYQGTWNASTNVPTLASSVGSKGYYYVVSTAGSTNLNGITDWKIGDWAVYDGSTWQKVDNTDAVSSVNGFTGAVVLTTTDVAQGTNLYFTQAAARGSVSAGTGISYNSTSGVITNSAPDQTVALTGAGTTVVTGTYPNFTITSNDSIVGTVTSVAASGGTTGLSFTGSPITTAGTLTLGGTLALANGGTGATTASGARTALELGTAATTNASAYATAAQGAKADTAVQTIASADGSVTITGTTAIDLSVPVTAATNSVILPVRNTTGATLTKGTAVYISGATGQISTVSKALATSDATSAQTLGLITANISNNANGNVTLIGTITNIDTSAYTDGQQLYLSPTTAGTLTATKPYAPQHLVYMAIVEHAHPSQGKLFVKVQNGYEMDELHNVSAQSPANNDGLFYNTTTSLWEKKSIVTALGYTPYNATNPAGYTTNTGTVTSVNLTAGTGVSVSGGPVTTSGAITVTNTAPDQVVSLTGAGTTTVTGTYPNFTVTSNDSTVGTVTSVGGTGTVSGLTLTGTVTTSGNLTLGGTLAVTPSNFASQTANTVLAAPNGAAGVPTFRAIVAADIPTLNQNTTGTASNVTGTVAVANGGTGATTLTSGYLLKGNGTSAVSASVVYDTGTNVGIGTTSPGYPLSVKSAASIGAIRIIGRTADNIGTLEFIDTTQATTQAYIQAGSTPYLLFGTSATERMRIDASGNVGIGTSSQTAKLEVVGNVLGRADNATGNSNLITSNTNSGNNTTKYSSLLLQGTDTVGTAKSTGLVLSGPSDANYVASYMTFSTRSADALGERMRITSAGDVGIGDAAPAYKLTVAGDLRLTGGGDVRLSSATGTTTSGGDSQLYNDANNMIFTTGTTTAERMRIDSSGNVGIGTSSPAGKLHVVTGTNDSILFRGPISFATGGSMYGVNAANTAIAPLEFAASAFYFNAGNVGIGTSSPGYKLVVSAASNTNPIAVISGSTKGIRLGADANGGIIEGVDNTGAASYQPMTLGGADIRLTTSGTERMRITSAGFVGVGTGAPGAQFENVGQTRLGANVTPVAPSATDILSTSHTAMGGNGGNYLTLGLYPGAQGFAQWIQSSFSNPTTAKYNLVLQPLGGNVGIGTDGPGYRLDVASGDTTGGLGYAMRLRSNATATAAALQFTNSVVSTENGLISCTDAGRITIQGSTDMAFRTNGNERARIGSDGHFGIGTTTRLGTNETLSVSAISTFDGMWVKNLSSSAATAVVWNAATSGDNSFISFGTEATVTGRGSITYNRAGGLVAYNVTSDYRAKDIIGQVTDAGATIDALKVYSGKMKGATIARPMLIAHEAQEVVPYAVTGEKDAVNEDGTDKHQQMDHQSFIPLLIAEIQSLRARVAQLEGN